MTHNSSHDIVMIPTLKKGHVHNVDTEDENINMISNVP